MELSSDSSSSDKDRKMMDSFEAFSDKEDSKEKKKKSKDKKTSVFVAASEEKKPERRGNIFDDLKTDKTKEKEPDDIKDVEKLSDSETRHVAEEFISDKTEGLKQELAQTEPDSLDEAQVLADAAFLESLKAKVAEDEPIDDAVLDLILEQTTQDLAINETENIAEENEMPLETSDEEEKDDNTVTQLSSVSKTGPPKGPPPTGSSGGGSTPPGGLSSGGTTGGGWVPPIPPYPNVNATNPNSEELYYTQRRRAGDLLLGGIIGYLIGRRRGRIKTEKRLIPLQEKLEKQVEDLQQKIEFREQKIRHLVAVQETTSPESTHSKMAERLTQRLEAQPVTENEKAFVSTEQARVSPEYQQIIEIEKSKTVRLEQLGKVIVPKPESLPTSPERPKDVLNLTVTELLEIAAVIKVEGASVKTMYEKGSLDAIGLRRVVGEYIRSGNYERLLADNLLSSQSPERLQQTTSTGYDNRGGTTGGGAAIFNTNQTSRAEQSRRYINTSSLSSENNTTQPEKNSSSRQLAKTAIVIGITLALGFVLFVLFQ